MKTTVPQRVFDFFNVLIMLLLMLATLYPFWHVVCASFSDGGTLLSHTGLLIAPLKFNFNSYKSVFGNPQIVSGYINTLIVLAGGLSLNMVMTSIGAYCLSRKNLYWTPFFMKLIIVTMFFSGGLIPTYLLISRTLNMNDSLLALIIPGAVNTYNLIIMRTSFYELPDSLTESAEIDGASHVKIITKIVIPLSLPVIAVITLFYAVGHWNSWFSASIYLKSRSKYPLQLVLREILIMNSTLDMSADAAVGEKYFIGETIKYAIIVVATVPILFLYPFLQRYFVKGIMIGAVKG
jgi:putative aldouronate transport system permease protein